MIVKNDLFDYENRYIYQDSEGFKFSVDSVLLAEFVRLTKNSINILDMCTGNSAIPLVLSTKTSAQIVGFEIQSSVYDLGKKSIDCNSLNEQVSIINDDIKNISSYYSKEFFDVIVCNPPFFKVGDMKTINNNMSKSIARHELYIALEDIFKLAFDYLKNNSFLYLVHRSTRIDELINLSIKYKINVKEIQFVSTKNGKGPTIVLVKCVKNSSCGVKIRPELCIENCKSYKNIFEECI